MYAIFNVIAKFMCILFAYYFDPVYSVPIDPMLIVVVYQFIVIDYYFLDDNVK